MIGGWGLGGWGGCSIQVFEFVSFDVLLMKFIQLNSTIVKMFYTDYIKTLIPLFPTVKLCHQDKL